MLTGVLEGIEKSGASGVCVGTSTGADTGGVGSVVGVTGGGVVGCEF